MPIATFGYKTFEVSSDKIYTFNELSTSYGLTTDEQEQENNKSSTWIKGYKLINLNFKIKLDARFVNVENERNEWQEICSSKNTYSFIVGGQPIYQCKFLLLDVDESDCYIDNKGKFLESLLSLKFQEFVRPGHKEDKIKKAKKEKPDYKSMIDEAQKRNNANAQKAYSEGIKEW